MQIAKNRRVSQWGVVLFIAFIAFNIVEEWRGLHRMHYIAYDYAFFYYAFQSVLHHQSSWTMLYNMHLEQIFLRAHHFPMDPYNQYVYPPQFAWIFSWLALVPFWLSATVWMMVSCTLYFCGLYWMMKTIWGRIRRIHLLTIFLIASVLTPFQVDLAVGNVNSILFAAMALTFYLNYYRNNPRLAGVPLGIAILLKVTPAALLLVFMLRRQWGICKSTIATTVMGTLVASVFVGFRPISDYLLHFSSFGHTSMKNGPAPYNQSIIGVLGMFSQHHWLNMPGGVQFFLYVLVSILALWGIMRVIRKSGSADWRLDIALASLTPLAFSPLVEETHMMFATPALIVFARMAYEADRMEEGRNRRTVRLLFALTIVTVTIESLPVTFLLNRIVAYWPQWFFVHGQMFFVLAISFIATLWLYNRTSNWPVPPPQFMGKETTGPSRRSGGDMPSTKIPHSRG